MKREQDYGLDVKWGAGEGRAFMAYNRMCGDQARAIFAWNHNPIGPKPATVPAMELAAIARASVA